MNLSYLYKPGSPLLLFLHGLGLSKEVMINSLYSIELRQFGILIPDLPGHGNSDPYPEDKKYTFQNMADTIANLLNNMNIFEFHLITHSIASNLISPLLNARGFNIRSIIMLEGNFSNDDTSWSRFLATMTNEEFLVYIKKLRIGAKFIIKNQLHTLPNNTDLTAYGYGFSVVAQRALKELAEDSVHCFLKKEAIKVLKTYKSNCVYIRGNDDREWQNTKILLESLNITVKNIKKAGHFPMIDQPEDTYKSISEIIANHIN
jgi:pimeloyl-ACP methyl ester carboxylesterase